MGGDGDRLADVGAGFKALSFLITVCGGCESLLEVDVLGGPMLLQVGKGYLGDNLFTIQRWPLSRLLVSTVDSICPSLSFLLLSDSRGVRPFNRPST